MYVACAALTEGKGHFAVGAVVLLEHGSHQVRAIQERGEASSRQRLCGGASMAPEQYHTPGGKFAPLFERCTDARPRLTGKVFRWLEPLGTPPMP